MARIFFNVSYIFSKHCGLVVYYLNRIFLVGATSFSALKPMILCFNFIFKACMFILEFWSFSVMAPWSNEVLLTSVLSCKAFY